jgi:hypothetical protein
MSLAPMRRTTGSTLPEIDIAHPPESFRVIDAGRRGTCVD